MASAVSMTQQLDADAARTPPTLFVCGCSVGFTNAVLLSETNSPLADPLARVMSALHIVNRVGLCICNKVVCLHFTKNA